MIQEHTWRYLDDMITRTGKSLGVFMNIIVSMENEIRESYSESTDSFGTNDLAKMMVLDGFFLIELFRKAGKLVNTHPDDPIFKMVWVSPFLMRDLLKIENQIPFFVLQKLFEESRTDSCTLQSLTLKFFNHAIDKQPKVLHKYENLDGKHLLDFLRKSFINTKDRHLIVNANNPSLKLIQPASKLANSRLKFKANHQADSFLDIKFQNGRLLIPQINIDDFHTSFLLNCMAFEQCYFSCTKDITTYVMFMSCLMKATTDVNFLSEKRIIENYCGTSEEIVKFFNDIGKDVAFDIKDNYLKGLFVEVNKYCENGWHVGWAEFRHTYFESPWASISALVPFMLLSLTVLQTFYTMYSYHKKKD
ncbi:hypothetical protein Hanom_Chr02g00168791 [Helianthus anomalus]